MSEPLSGTQFQISAGPYAATVTEAGAGLRSLDYRDRGLITGYRADETCPAGHGQLLAPWPNRIDHGAYRFEGVDHRLDITEPARDTAIHGLTRWAPWRPAEQLADRVTLTHRLLGHPGYPFRLDLSVQYLLAADTGLTVTVHARNAGSRTAPFGTGAHPYLTAGSTSIDACMLTVPADRWLRTDERGIPGRLEDVTGTDRDFRAGAPLRGVRLDHAFTELHRDSAGRAWVSLIGPEDGTMLWVDSAYRWLEVFTGDALPPSMARAALAVEPMTCPPNAFASGTDVIALDPGEVHTCRWGIMRSGAAIHEETQV